MTVSVVVVCVVRGVFIHAHYCSHFDLELSFFLMTRGSGWYVFSMVDLDLD